ncbi:hypothetical protein [Pengzhenrongella sicca]|uniref:Uncharacterized protein n=1 Tax=Pengzhenrongella sicca TaxID=2819238 RepID=A0A8A4ZHG2_9MICO|nr:hypothetical protein [Pengzhenrongella sicca]QTE29966.1 hypothetical protein J4E96_02765 [Pengzhenrongella sicca]
MSADRMSPARALARVRRDDRGVGTIEYLGVIVLAALLVTALVLGITNARYAERLEAALCEITSLGQGGCAMPSDIVRAAEDYVPPDQCIVSSTGNDSSGKLTVVVTLESGEQWAINQLGDGTYQLTRAADGSVGIGVGVGFDVSATVDNEKFGVGAYANVAAALAIGGGESFTASSAEDAMQILHAQQQDDTKDAIFGDDNAVRDGADWLNETFGGSNDNEDAEPDEWFTEGGFVATGTAGSTAITGSVEASASVEAYVGRTDRKDGTSTDYLRAEMAIDGGVTGWGPDASGNDSYINYTAEGSAGAVVEIDRDKDGNPTTFRMTSVLMGNATGEQSYSGDGGIDSDPTYTERTVSFPLETASDRALASRVLQAAGIPYYPGVTDGIDVPQAATDKLDPTALGGALFEAASTRGHIYEQEYTTSTDESGFNAEGKLGLELGLGGSSIDSTRTTTGYTYWDGSSMVDRAGCF